MKRVNPYDRSLKVLARHYPQAFISLLIELTEDIEITVENPEINLPEKRADYVWKVSDGQQEGYFIFEFQLQPRQDALRSAFTKCALVHEATSLPVIGVILYLRKGSDRQEYEISFRGRTNQYRFEIIRLWDYREEIESGRRKELAPLLVPLSDHPDEAVLNREKELIMQVEDEKERADLLSIAMTLALRYFKEDWLKEYFKEEMAMIKTANIVQEWIDEGMQKGRKEGIKEGIREGTRQGAIETAQASVIEVLEARFDLVSGELVKSIKQIDEIVILQKLLKKAAVLESLEEFKKVLKILTD